MWKFVFNFILERKFLKCMWEKGKNNGKEGGVQQYLFIYLWQL